MDGAVSAAKEKHEVIMTPTSHCYFDYYQSENEDEPLAIGGYLPLAKVYAFNPIPEVLSPEEHQYVIGAQGNVWTEYMPTARQVEYMAFPRAVALSEVLWTNEENKDYQLFLSKLEYFNKRLDLLAVHYANHLYDVTGDVLPVQEGVRYTLRNTIDTKEIRYTLDGSEPTQHSKRFMRPIDVNQSLQIKAATFSNKERLGKVYEQQLDFHKAVGKSIKINAAPHHAYNAGGNGVNAIINGIKGSDLRYGDREWLGFWGNDLEIQIDLGSSMYLNTINLRFFDANGQWIYAPKAIQIFESSSSDKKHPVNDLVMKTQKNIQHVRVTMNKKSRHITIVIPKYGIIPKGFQGAGNEAWTFIDEIIIN
jgi:hexosaminidase